MDWREGFDDSLLDEEALNYLINHELEEASAGISRQVLTQGLYSLSESQLRVFKTHVVDKWLMCKCKCGNHPVEAHELIGIWVNDGYCARCADRMDKDFRRKTSVT